MRSFHFLLVTTAIILVTQGCDSGCARFNSEQVCVVERRFVDPVLKSKQFIRSQVSAGAPKVVTAQFDDLSLVGAGEQILYLVDKGNGIHIFDFEANNSPTNLAYLKIPGVSEAQIKGDALYADSYTDLHAFNISNPAAVELTKSFYGVFPDTVYRTLPEDIEFKKHDLQSNDLRNRFVVGYRERRKQ